MRPLDLVAVLTLTSLCSGCIVGAGPANRVEDFQHLALQLDSRLEQVRMAGKVQWHVGAENIWEAYDNTEDRQWAHARAKCEAQKTKGGGWCLALPHGHPDTGVFLMTDQELAFFRWEDDAYVVAARVPFSQIERVRLDRIAGIGAKYLVIRKDGQPLLLYVLLNRVISSYAGTEALYKALMERVRWGEREAAPQ